MKMENKIGLGVAVIIGINAMIGAGIVAIPAFLSKQVGPAGVFSYAFSIFVVMCMSLSLARLSEKHPGEGWSYRYPKLWGGHTVGLFSAFSYVLGVLVAMGFLVQQAGVWMQFFFPDVGVTTLATASLLILTALVITGAEVASWGQYVIAGVVVSSLAITTGVCLSNFDLSHVENFMPGGVVSVFAAAPKAMFTMLGFESVASLYSIVKNPRRNIPLACLLSVLVVGTLYLTFTGSILVSIPMSAFAQGAGETLPSVLGRVFPEFPFLTKLVLLGGLFAILGTLHSMIWSVAVLLTSVLEKVQSPSFQRVLQKPMWNEKTSVALTAGGMLVTSLLMRSELILDVSVCLIATTYITSTSLMLFHKEEWKNGRNVLSLIAVGGGLTLIYFSLKPWLMGS